MGFHAECKARSQKLELTPVKGRLLWKKLIDGKLAYFTGSDTEEGYNQALGAYRRRDQVTSSQDTIETAAQAYLAGRTRGRSCWTGKANRQRLGYFTKLFGKECVTSINGIMVSRFHGILESRDLDPRTCYHAYRMLVSFVEWAAATYDFELPKNLRLLGFKQGLDRNGEAKEIDPGQLWTVEDFELATSYGDFWELIVLLCLNCGFTNTDLDKLTGHLDAKHGTGIHWAAGRIIHKRNKTKRFQNSPKVNYKLWPRTMELLERFGARDGLALSLDGRRLQTRTNDHLSRAWKKLDHPKQLKFIRKTGATWLHRHFNAMKQVYLCDKTGIADSAYVYFSGEPCDDLDEAICSLGKALIGSAVRSTSARPDEARTC